MTYKMVSLDTAGEEPAYDRELAKLMEQHPTAASERVKMTHTKAGNIVKAR